MFHNDFMLFEAIPDLNDVLFSLSLNGERSLLQALPKWISFYDICNDGWLTSRGQQRTAHQDGGAWGKETIALQG